MTHAPPEREDRPTLPHATARLSTGHAETMESRRSRPAHLTVCVAIRKIAVTVTPTATNQSHRRAFTIRSDTMRIDTAARWNVTPLDRRVPVAKARIQFASM